MGDIALSLTDAVERFSKKTPIGGVLDSAGWQKVPVALRERAQFSSGVVSMRLLQAIQDRLKAELERQRDQMLTDEEKAFDRKAFVAAIWNIARDEGLFPSSERGWTGGIQNLKSLPRLELIYNTQIEHAKGYAMWKLEQSEGAVAACPAYRLGPSTAQHPRTDWPQRWLAAGASVGFEGALQDQMIALKSSPIWSALSRFGTPWPPFDLNSTRKLEEVSRAETEACGLLAPGELATSGEQSFNSNLKASVRRLGKRKIELLQDYFGRQFEVKGGTARWKE